MKPFKSSASIKFSLKHVSEFDGLGLSNFPCCNVCFYTVLSHISSSSIHPSPLNPFIESLFRVALCIFRRH